MRGKISDQDLTDYALNELQPEERLYVESMLGVSEECRHDVYQMIELSQLLEEGFEKEESRHQHTCLTGGQRAELLRGRSSTYPFWQKTAAVLIGAASVGFTLAHTEVGTMEAPARQVAEASKHAAMVVADAVGSSDMVEIKNAFQSLRAMAGDSSELLQADVITTSPMICTPPTLFETAQLTGRADMGQ